MKNNSLYSFHPTADEQQTDIWLYTCQNWSIAQADSYIDGLHDKLAKVALDFSLLRSVPQGINEKIKFFHYGRHYVFIKKASNNRPEKIQVLAILHASMDVPVKLCELLSSKSY